MLDYLNDYNFSNEDITLVKKSLNQSQIQNLDIMKENVIKNIKIFNKHEITRLTELLIKRSDIFIKEESVLKENIGKHNPKFIKHIIEISPEDLVNFDF